MSTEVTHNWDDENYIETLNTAFDEYRQACYGDRNLPDVQLKEVRQAFFSGIHWLNTRESYDPDELEQGLRAVCLPEQGTSDCDAT